LALSLGPQNDAVSGSKAPPTRSETTQKGSLVKSLLEPTDADASNHEIRVLESDKSNVDPQPVASVATSHEENPKFDHSRAAVASWIQDFHQDVYRFSYWISGCPNAAEDVTQETFLRAFHAARKGSGPREPEKTKSWLLTIARNEFARYAKRQNKILASSEVTDSAVQTENTLSAEDDREWLSSGLQALSENYRTILLMYYFDDQSYAEIAAIMGIPIGTVMSRLSRAKKSLKRHLTQSEQQLASPDH
jgi:RNA polymerase sigma factor (sigma-70 family)